MPETPEIPENSNEAKRLTRLSVPSIIALVVVVLLIGVMAQSLIKNQSTTEITPEPNATPTVDATPQPTSDEYVLFVPNDNALLSRETVTDTSTPPDATYSQKAERALALLFPKLEYLPKDTKVLEAPTKDEKGVVRVNFSKEFMQLDPMHETPVMLTLDAMARTLGALDSTDGKTFESAKMQVLVEGKTIETLSQFALDEPWTASETDSGAPAAEDAI